MNFTPTAEQAAALEAFRSGRHLALQAGAGTGKTSTLALLAGQNPTRRGRYLAFNRTIARTPPPASPQPSSVKPPTPWLSPPSATATPTGSTAPAARLEAPEQTSA